MYKIITGMSRSYYDNIGKSMVESWLSYWPKEFELTIYSEDDISFLESSRIKIIHLNTLGEKYIKFQNADYKKSKLKDRMKTYAKKAFPIIENLSLDSGKLIWIDADVITINKINVDWLDSLIAEDSFSAHLGCPQSVYYSVETGFFIINLENKFKDEFKKRYENVYYNLDFTNMKKPYDGDTFGRIITELKDIPGFNYTELSPDINIKSPFNLVFEGKMYHYKAKRKQGFEFENE